MTVQFLAAWNGYEQFQVATLAPSEETRLVGLGVCRLAESAGSSALLAQQPSGDVAAGGATVLTASAIDAVKYAHPRAWLRSHGTMLCDWRGTVTGSGISVDATTLAPDGSAVVALAGDATTDTGGPGNNSADQVITATSTKGLQSIGIRVKVGKRNGARKNYRNVPLKILIGVDNTFAKYFQFTFNARADGRWHFYVLDVSYAGLSGFVMGTDTMGVIRIRASIDSGVTANALTGTAPLQTGETAYFGGIVTNPRAQAMALVRFDDMMKNLYSSKDWVVASQYSGVSGVVVPAGSYSAFDLLNMYGFVGSCFILTKYLNYGGSPYFESVQGLRALQDAGWEICWQTHNNPTSASNYGVRLLGPLGVNWFPQASINHAVDGTVTTATSNDIASGTGQGTPVTLTGTPPAPLVAGQTYWIRGFSATTAKLYSTEADALANVGAIAFAAGGSAAWGWSFAGATADASAINNEFQQGIAAMKAAGLNGWMHWAPNQGAFDTMMEDAFYANGMQSCWPIGYGSMGTALGITSQMNFTLGLVGYVPHLPTFMTTLSAYATDAAGATEANARAYVQSLCRYGGIGQNYHHNSSNVNVLLAYLDELKFRQDSGEIVVTTPTQIANVVRKFRLDA